MDFAARPMEVFTHKFFTPISYPGAIQRDELLARLFRAPAYGAVVIQAPAGHGKSTLLQQAKHHDESQDTIKIGRAHVELQSLMRNSYAVFCLKKKTNNKQQQKN